MRIVVSLTTSPFRLTQIETTLDSILLHQTVLPAQVHLNLPPVFARTGEPYPETLPVFFQKYGDRLVVNRTCPDLGPITKLTGCLEALSGEDDDDNVWIVTIDDDIRYLPETISLYKETLIRRSNRNVAMGLSGFFWSTDGSIIAQHENGPCHILEGYGSVCYRKSHFPAKSWGSYLKKCLENQSCKFSDDVIISNWLAMRGVPRIIVATPWTNRRVMWQQECILPYGNESDALHLGGCAGGTNNVERYNDVRQHLSKQSLFSRDLQF